MLSPQTGRVILQSLKRLKEAQHDHATADSSPSERPN